MNCECHDTEAEHDADFARERNHWMPGPIPTGGGPGNRRHLEILCDWAGCNKAIEGAPIYCGTHPFCSWECCDEWQEYRAEDTGLLYDKEGNDRS